MKRDEVKEYLEESLPLFTYRTNDIEGNENKLWVERYGQHIIIDVSKVNNRKDCKKLAGFIEAKWKDVA